MCTRTPWILLFFPGKSRQGELQPIFTHRNKYQRMASWRKIKAEVSVACGCSRERKTFHFIPSSIESFECDPERGFYSNGLKWNIYFEIFLSTHFVNCLNFFNYENKLLKTVAGSLIEMNLRREITVSIKLLQELCFQQISGPTEQHHQLFTGRSSWKLFFQALSPNWFSVEMFKKMAKFFN